MPYCICPECMGGVIIPIIIMPGIGGMGGMVGGCGDPICPLCGGGMGGTGRLEGLSGMGSIPPCGIPGCTGQCLEQCGCPECLASRSGMGGMGGMPPNIIFPGGGGGGTMPPIIWPGPSGRGGMSDPDYGGRGGGGGGYPQPPTGPGNSGEQTPAPTGPGMYADPKLVCKGMTGLPIDCTIDTGMQPAAQVTLSGYSKHFPSQPVDRSVDFKVMGVGSGPVAMAGRFLMKLTLDFGNEQTMVEGNCWIYPNDNCPTELLLGMPFLKKNKMHLRFGHDGDSIEIEGRRVPIRMKKDMFRKIYPPREPFYEGSGKSQFTLGGEPVIVPQSARQVAHHHLPTHGRHTVHASHGHHRVASKDKAAEEILASSDSGDEDEALQMALAESVKNITLNNINKNTHRNKLQEELPRQTLLKSVVSEAPRNSHAKLQSGRSVEDMARIISGRAAEKSRRRAQSKKEDDMPIDKDLDRAIAMSLEGFD